MKTPSAGSVDAYVPCGVAPASRSIAFELFIDRAPANGGLGHDDQHVPRGEDKRPVHRLVRHKASERLVSGDGKLELVAVIRHEQHSVAAALAHRYLDAAWHVERRAVG